MERAKLNPVKDKERAALVAPYLAKLKSLRENPPKSAEARALWDEMQPITDRRHIQSFQMNGLMVGAQNTASSFHPKIWSPSKVLVRESAT